MDVDCNSNVLVAAVIGPSHKLSSSSREAMVIGLNSPGKQSDSDLQ